MKFAPHEISRVPRDISLGIADFGLWIWPARSRRGVGGRWRRWGAVVNPQSEIRNPKSRRAAPAFRWERPSGVWRCLPGTLPAHPYHRAGSLALAGWVLSRERSWLWACARGPGQTAGSHHCALPGLAAPGAFRPGCLAAPHNRYHPATTPVTRPGGPAGGGGASGAVTPNRFAFGVSGPVSPSPPAVWLSATPPPTPRNVAALAATSKPLMTRSRSPSRTLEQPPTITSHPVIGQDKTNGREPRRLM